MTVDGEEIKAQIWDTAGQERFSSMMGTYYRKAKGALLLFSVSDKQSFVDAAGWLQQIQELGEEGTMVLLVGNKCDMESTAREVPTSARDLTEGIKVATVRAFSAIYVSTNTFHLPFSRCAMC